MYARIKSGQTGRTPKQRCFRWTLWDDSDTKPKAVAVSPIGGYENYFAAREAIQKLFGHDVEIKYG